MDLTTGGGSDRKATDGSDQKTADATALDLIKQLITLSSGVLALSATFIEKFATNRLSLILLLAVSWLLLMFAIYSGLQAMSAMVKAMINPDFEFVRDHLTKYAKASKFSFALGISCFACFAFSSFLVSVDNKEREEQRKLLAPQKAMAPDATQLTQVVTVASPGQPCAPASQQSRTKTQR